ncbi:MAG TPA: FtsK/SpoIIIE domain-containing protein [Galbitalea sp.]|jgi:S-DNA-T family DNA segregation ATPase FtsK/SpoIIIE|nr:FtsK/SpoIIIE domain-containing protein [Galbitalea sp.]
MLAIQPRRTVNAPKPAEVEPLRRFPIVATLAPVVAAVVLFAITRSAFTLAFALLGPVVALGALADSAWQRQRSRGREDKRFASEVERARREVQDAHAAELHDLNRDAPSAIELLESSRRPPNGWPSAAGGGRGAVRVRLGSGDLPSSLAIERSAAIHGRETDDRLAELHARAAVLHGAPIVVEAHTGIVFLGPAVQRLAAARGVLLQLAVYGAAGSATLAAPSDPAWDWIAGLPQAVSRVDGATRAEFVTEGASFVVAVVDAAAAVPHDVDVVVELDPDGLGRLVVGPGDMATSSFRPEYVGVELATRAAQALTARAGNTATASGIPSACEFASLTQSGADGILAATIGIGPAGPLTIDLVRDGPHAIIGGTTGSGKSELLVSWVLAMAAERSPDVVTFLFVDFKGGAAFEPLSDLPHCVGVITDLDAAQSLRALASLAAELRHRERTLSECGLRSIDESRGDPPFPRLVVMVDEYAALVETHSSLHGVFADIASRGRSLGVHLVLCTQRPAGVVRDGILANCALRVSLRVLTAADSSAVIGTDAAAALASAPAGRALVGIAGAAPTAVQVARSSRPDATALRLRWGSASRPRAPWLPPLPARIPVESAAAYALDDGLPFAMTDLPERQAQELAVYRPASDGSLLVIGAAGSGKTGLIAALLAARSTTRVRHLPRGLPELWDALDSRPTEVAGEHVLLLDDVDQLISTADDAYQQGLLESLGRLLREGRASGVHLVLTAQRITGAIQSLTALCGSVVVLRMPNQQEHVLAGGSVGDFRDDAVAGSGTWRGHRVQVLDAPRGVRPAEAPIATTLTLDSTALAVVSTRPEQFAERMRAVAPARAIVVLGQSRADVRVAVDLPPSSVPPILVADPETWQAHWNSFVSALRSSDVLFDGCSSAEVRTLTRNRQLPPPFLHGQRPLWLLTNGGDLSRARLPPAATSADRC